MKPVSALEWFIEAGIGDISGDKPANFFAESSLSVKNPAIQAKSNYTAPVTGKTPYLQEDFAEFKVRDSKPAAAASQSLASAIAEARQLADEAKTLEDLKAAVCAFTGCGLKKTANKTVFADGNPESPVMIIGEAPGADEDREGIPFCGQSGKLLDKVLLSINLTRKGAREKSFYITNTLFWRPPGNRKPTPEELSICEPFVEKHIALISPKILLLAGATAVQMILKNNSAMGKLRGNTYHYKNRYMQHDVPVMVTYHPSFLLRAPINKRLAWEDMLLLQEKLKELEG